MISKENKLTAAKAWVAFVGKLERDANARQFLMWGYFDANGMYKEDSCSDWMTPARMSQTINELGISRDILSVANHKGFRGDKAIVYFAKAGKFVKIGRTYAPLSDRIAALQMYCPLKVSVVHAMLAPPETEQEIHKKFKPHRMHGEWFRHHKDIDNFVRAIKAKGK